MPTIGVNHRTRLAAILALAMTCIFACNADAIVVHPDTSSPSDVPVDSFIGTVGVGSAVAVAPDWIIMTDHQSGSSATFGGQDYDFVSSPIVIGLSGSTSADLRLVQVRPADSDRAANLPYVELYTEQNEVGKRVIMGGFGRTRGDAITNGYLWSYISKNVVWGENLVYRTENSVDRRNNQNVLVNESNTIVADFDRPATGLPTEAALAARDSGGPWLIDDDGMWKVAGLSAYAENATLEKSMYQPAGDNWAIRISEYADEIMGHIGDRNILLGDANGDGQVDGNDLIAVEEYFGVSGGLYNLLGDANSDGQVDGNDLIAVEEHFGTTYLFSEGEPWVASSTSAIDAVPEPVSAVLLGVGGLALLGRRR